MVTGPIATTNQVVDPRHVRAYTSEVLADAYRRACRDRIG